jgi:hypothetical protein
MLRRFDRGRETTSADVFVGFQGAPYVCLSCKGIGHLKRECPELIIPTMDALPTLNNDWLKVLSQVFSLIVGERETRVGRTVTSAVFRLA